MNGWKDGIRIRRAGPCDLEAVYGVLSAAFEAWASYYTDSAFAKTVPSPAALLGRLSEGPVWIAVHRDDRDNRQRGLAGTVGAVEEDDGLYLRSLAVAPAVRGRGVGGALVETAEAYALARGLRRIHLSTTPFLLPAIRLYRRLGFVETNAGPRYLAGTPLVSMEKPLPIRPA